MNLEKILDRLHEIEESITKGVAQVHVLHGHKAEMQHWIQKFQESSVEDNQPLEDKPLL